MRNKKLLGGAVALLSASMLFAGCGSRKVEKAIMAPRVGKSSSEMAELRKKLVEHNLA